MAKSNPATMTLVPFLIQMLQKDIDELPKRIKVTESGMKPFKQIRNIHIYIYSNTEIIILNST